ncbi:uncharacterized protein TNIN_69271 [Trichonephila inaurata madagascariensis]|uniref:Uncharacterized protein n=1 Tax=Trichonephila inaurata madagascariensis TaxID=2747483 RepID=A0A8X6Y038_9ARAC|nr:uncharacterized protein TNIN_69271 [Trichonephila inaurata madagascariensis]
MAARDRSGALLLLLVISSSATYGTSLDRLLEVLQGVPGTLQRGPRNAPPRYMLDLYRSVAAPDGLTVSPTPYSANVVRCYADRGKTHFPLCHCSFL